MLRRLCLCLPLIATAFAEEAVVSNNAIVPVPKLENDSYDWYKRHEDILRLKQGLDPEIVLIGDSITHFWGGQPESPGVKARGPKAWEKAFGTKRTLNLGFGWDRTQNVLWRLDHGEFDGLHPKWVVLNIGTNNFSGTKNARASTPAGNRGRRPRDHQKGTGEIPVLEGDPDGGSATLPESG